jgi:hypothetical protein
VRQTKTGSKRQPIRCLELIFDEAGEQIAAGINSLLELPGGAVIRDHREVGIVLLANE